MKKLIIVFGIWLIFISLLCLVGLRNVNHVKSVSIRESKRLGYSNCVYEGYQMNVTHGGMVWYQCQKRDVLYTFALARWFNEIHLYNIKALDALNPSQK